MWLSCALSKWWRSSCLPLCWILPWNTFLLTHRCWRNSCFGWFCCLSWCGCGSLITWWSLEFLGFRSLLVSCWCPARMILGCVPSCFSWVANLCQAPSLESWLLSFLVWCWWVDVVLPACLLTWLLLWCTSWSLSPIRSCAEELLPLYLPAHPLRASVRDCMLCFGYVLLQMLENHDVCRMPLALGFWQ